MYRIKNLYQEGDSYAELERPSAGFECKRSKNTIDFFIFGSSDEFLKVMSGKIHKKRISLQVIRHNSAIMYVLLYHTHKYRMRTLEYPSQVRENAISLGTFNGKSLQNNNMVVKFHSINKETGKVWAIDTFKLTNEDAMSLKALIIEACNKDYNADDYYKDAQYCQALKDRTLVKSDEYSYLQVEFN